MKNLGSYGDVWSQMRCCIAAFVLTIGTHGISIAAEPTFYRDVLSIFQILPDSLPGLSSSRRSRADVITYLERGTALGRRNP